MRAAQGEYSSSSRCSLLKLHKVAYSIDKLPVPVQHDAVDVLGHHTRVAALRQEPRWHFFNMPVPQHLQLLPRPTLAVCGGNAE